MHKDIHCIIVYDCEKMEKNECPTEEWLNKQWHKLYLMKALCNF